MARIQRPDLSVLANKLALEGSLRDGYRNGKWVCNNSRFCFTFSPQGPVLGIPLEPEKQNPYHIVEYNQEFDKVGIRGKPPSDTYFRRRGFFLEPGMHYDIATGFELFRHTRALVFAEGQYASWIAEGQGRQVRVLKLLNKTLKKTEIGKHIIDFENQALDGMLYRLQVISAHGL